MTSAREGDDDRMTTFDRLVEFLLARIAEDEALARRALEDWYSVEGGGLRWGEVGHEASPDLTVDPCRVLAECEAKRRIVDLHAPATAHSSRALTCETCLSDRAGWSDDWGADQWPCDTLRALVSVYADHPDCDPTWLPTED
jgi:hypothetical protein